MLSKEERQLIYRHAYIPEHLPDYVSAVSGAEPHLFQKYLCYSKQTHLIFIGFSLGRAAVAADRAYLGTCEQFNPSSVVIIAPEVWLPQDGCEKQPKDNYYRLKLPVDPLDPEVAYMVRRAHRDLVVTRGKFGREHKRLVKEFLKDRNFTRQQIYLFTHIHHYLKRCSSAMLLDARMGRQLAGFTVLDLGSANYAFYLFNFRSTKVNIPGTSDLLMQEMVTIAQTQGKQAINLGLGINSGIRRYKEKWGGVPFWPYESAVVHRQTLDLERLARKL